ncbi:MAG: hypothetical protein IJA44_06110 [Clostridia bacterium]|nr:hypothetical protein [Clostridia bacterium]
MIKILLADLVIEVDNKYNYIRKLSENYAYEGDRPTDIFISVSEEDLNKERDDSVNKKFHNAYLEYICAYRKIANELLKFDAFVMHGTVIEVENKGIMFTALSGTGKTTHMLYWQEMLGDQLKIINGDKPIIRFFDGVPYAYGTPWAGKEGFNTNARTELRDICLIERADVNEVVPLTGFQIVSVFIKQIYHPEDLEARNKTYDLANKLLSYCNLRKIRCTKDISAAKTAYNAILG